MHGAADAMPRQQSIIVIVSIIVEDPCGADMINCGEEMGEGCVCVEQSYGKGTP